MTTTLHTERVALTSLQPYPGNPRKGDLQLIKDSLEANGQYRPIVAQKSTRFILAGNHTWRAAKELGWTEMDVSFVDCDDETAKRIVLVDNRSNDVAGYDDHALLSLLQDLEGGYAGTGYGDDDLTKLLDKLAGPHLPNEGESPNPALLGEKLVQLHCSREDLDEFEPVLTDWAARDSVTVEIT